MAKKKKNKSTKNSKKDKKLKLKVIKKIKVKKRSTTKKRANSSLQTLAAIDIGSNAIRLVVGQLNSKGRISILDKWRAPVRLGEDVFLDGNISATTINKALLAFKSFADTINTKGVQFYRAVATSAIREATNKEQFVADILKETNLRVEIIDGTEEAQLIYKAVSNSVDISNHRCLLIDVGGGSVEASVADHGSLVATQSFPLGTVRLIDELKKIGLSEEHLPELIESLFAPMAAHIEAQNPAENKFDFAIGTGGNLESLGQLRVKLLKQKSAKVLKRSELRTLIQKIKYYTLKGRTDALGLRPDRADVIVPAALVVEKIMTDAQIEKIIIPQIGLREGLLWSIAKSLPQRV
jgi:exopolyphosphatase / guanosine-5'-triphosphate,3'-diphosphate pyrophosphatase